jgi:hypothetical protein
MITNNGQNYLKKILHRHIYRTISFAPLTCRDIYIYMMLGLGGGIYTMLQTQISITKPKEGKTIILIVHCKCIMHETHTHTLLGSRRRPSVHHGCNKWGSICKLGTRLSAYSLECIPFVVVIVALAIFKPWWLFLDRRESIWVNGHVILADRTV